MGGAARAGADGPRWSPSSSCATSRCRASTCARRSTGPSAARRRRSASDKRVTNSEGAIFARDGRDGVRHLGGFVGRLPRHLRSRSSSSRCATTQGGKKRNGYWWTRRASGAARWTPRRSASRPRGARWPSSARARSRPRGAGHLRARGRAQRARAAGRRDPGGAVWRKSSYLAQREGTPIASPLVTIVDDPLLPRAPGSRPFDGEGLATRTNVVVDAGRAEDVPVRHLQRPQARPRVDGLGRARHRRQPARHHLELHPARRARRRPRQLEQVDRALYVTELMGFGFNAVTGDFSRGAGGFWIEKGEAHLPGQRGHHLGQLRRPPEAHRRRRQRPRHPLVGRSARASASPG